MLLDYMQVGETISVSYFDKNGKTQIKEIPLEENQIFNWEYCKSYNIKKADPKYVSWDGKPVMRVRPKDGRLSIFRIAEIIDDLPKDEYDEIFEYNLPQTYFVDIETKIDPTLTVKESAEQARQPITLIGIATPNRTVIVLSGGKDLTPNEQHQIQHQVSMHTKPFGVNFRFQFKCFPDETSMLKYFMHSMVRKFPVMSGWNFVDFDWQYITNRCKRLQISIAKASRIEKVIGKDKNMPAHACILDYMQCYSKWDTSVSQKENLKLDQAGEDVLGVKKVHYDGTLDDLYRDNFRDYVYYNAIDCALVEMLHEKLGVSSIGNTLTYIAQCPTTRMFSPVSLTESILARNYYKINRVLPVVKKDNKQEGYEGAYVKAPIVGFHRYCICNDFASLYPNIIRELNLSPETFLEKLDESDIEAKQKKLMEGLIVSESGCVFSKEAGVFSTLVGEVYNKRKSYKKTAVNAAIKSRLLEDLLKKSNLSDEKALAEYEKIIA